MSGYKINPNYLITLQARPLRADKEGNTITLQTPVPESFSVQINTDWQAQFANALEEGIGKIPGRFGAAATAGLQASKAMGFQPQSKVMSAQIWQGTSSLDITIPFILKAEKSAGQEVMEPIRRLMRLALPTTFGIGAASVLQAPFNPAEVARRIVANGGKGGARTAGNAAIQVQVGRFFYMPDCIIKSISQSYDSIFDEFGMPLSAKVDVSVSSFFIITAEDIDTMFPSGIGTQSAYLNPGFENFEGRGY